MKKRGIILVATGVCVAIVGAILLLMPSEADRRGKVMEMVRLTKRFL